MAKKQFKTESKKLLDLMINSIYTHKEIFLRELISNASDALDKRHYLSLTDNSLASDTPLSISISVDKEKRILTIEDNGIGMDREDL
ncbi:MAG TPA: ATP-binding protein, partial [Erysipelotrichaceae bacterium]|nr:ATP-binding protein [Erysipelotrichaceae bacterium]